MKRAARQATLERVNDSPNRDFSTSTAPPAAPLLRFCDVLDELLADARAANQARTSGQPRGPITGFATLDRELSHALAPGLHSVQGNAGAGKTAFALQIAASCRFPALYVTCEMAPAELLRRHTARATETYLGRLKSGELSVEAVETLTRRALSGAPDMALLDATRAPASPQRIYEAALVAKGERESVLVVVDSLQSWAEGLSEALGTGEYETLNLAIKKLREVAHALKCPVMFISERNRESNKDTKSDGLNAGAGTRKIEYGTETVFDLDRNMTETEDGAGEFEVTLRLPKNRHGSIGKRIPFQFNGALQRFRESERGDKGSGSRR